MPGRFVLSVTPGVALQSVFRTLHQQKNECIEAGNSHLDPVVVSSSSRW